MPGLGWTGTYLEEAIAEVLLEDWAFSLTYQPVARGEVRWRVAILHSSGTQIDGFGANPFAALDELRAAMEQRGLA